ncbi:MAG: ChbG/HpnK family deacetylase [Acidimicrobiia bacterium]
MSGLAGQAIGIMPTVERTEPRSGPSSPPVRPRLLIVNADDYGLTQGVSRAILRAHHDGIVTSTSALAVGPAFAATAPWLDEAPALGVGAHLAAVGEDPPLLSAAEVPTLVDRHGRLALSWRQFLPRMAAGRVDPADLEREFAAQIEAVVAAVGRSRVTHVDTHQHLHLWPRVGTVVLTLAQRWKVPAVRVPGSVSRAPAGLAVNALAARLRRRLRTAGSPAAPEAFAGFDEGGTLAEPELVATVDRLGATGAVTAELGLHPGEHDDPDLARYQWGYRWGDELAALVSSTAREAVARNGFELGSFAALEGRGR